MFLKGLIIAVCVLYAAALLGFVSAWIAETVIDEPKRKETAAKIKSGFLSVVCLPYWLYKYFKQKKQTSG